MNGSDGSKSTLNRVCQQRTIGKWLKAVKMSNRCHQGKSVTVTLFFSDHPPIPGSDGNIRVLCKFLLTQLRNSVSVTVQ